ncbi:MAG TPA: hypothetical protein ENN41_09600, partial [Sediminispirochaeta sp.]|nr:hypothetical protein [Sediminispirochaeta sp.]
MDIPKKMKAAVLYDFNDVRVEERDVPEPGPEDVLVKVESCGICGTDVKVVTQGMPKMPPMGDFIIGHEYSGTVVKTGETVDEFKPGDRVAVEVHKGCGRCKNCLLGDYTACMNYGDKGNVPFGYDEFEHVARIGFTSMPIAVRADAPYQSLEEFVEYA